MSRAHLYQVRRLNASAYAEQIVPAVQAWCERTPFSPITDWAGVTVLVEAQEKPSYLLRTTATRESRSKAMVCAPYRGEVLPSHPRDFGSVDPWEIAVGLAYEGGATRHFDLPDTQHCQTCHTCAGQGQVRCDRCRGSGEVSCSRCSGSGQVSETQRTQEPRRCHMCNGAGFTGFGQSRERCHRCGGNGMRLEDVSHSVRVPCGSCAARGRVVCGRCDGSGALTCGSCEGSGQILWWARITSVEDQVASDAHFGGVSGYDPQVRARTIVGDVPADLAAAKADPASGTQPLNGFDLTQSEPGYDAVTADYDDFDALANPATMVGDAPIRTWFASEINRFKQLHEADRGTRLMRVTYWVFRSPVTVVRYQYGGREFVLWVNPRLGLVEDHDGPMAQAAADSLGQSVRLADAGQWEESLGWACRAIVTDDARPHELQQRRRINRNLTFQYVSGALLGAGAAGALARQFAPDAPLQPLVLAGVWVLLFISLTKFVWLVRSTQRWPDRLLITAALGSLAAAAATLQPTWAGYAAAGLGLVGLCLWPANHRLGYPESLKSDASGRGAEGARRIESVVKALVFRPGLRRLRLVVQSVALVGVVGLLGAAWYGQRLSASLIARSPWTKSDGRAVDLALRLNPHLTELKVSRLDRVLRQPAEVPVAADLVARFTEAERVDWQERRVATTPEDLEALAARRTEWNQLPEGIDPVQAARWADSIDTVILRLYAATVPTATDEIGAGLAERALAFPPDLRARLLEALLRVELASESEATLQAWLVRFDGAELLAAAGRIAGSAALAEPMIPGLPELAAQLATGDRVAVLQTLGRLRSTDQLNTPSLQGLALVGRVLAEAETQAVAAALERGESVDWSALDAYYAFDGGFAANPVGARIVSEQADRAEARGLEAEVDQFVRDLAANEPVSVNQVSAARRLAGVLVEAGRARSRTQAAATALRPVLDAALARRILVGAEDEASAQRTEALAEAGGLSPDRLAKVVRLRDEVREWRLPAETASSLEELAERRRLAEAALARYEADPDRELATAMLAPPFAARQAQLEAALTAERLAAEAAERERQAQEDAIRREREQQEAALARIAAEAEPLQAPLAPARRRYDEYVGLLAAGQWRAAANLVEQRSLSITDAVAEPIVAALRVAAGEARAELPVDPAMTRVFPAHPVLDRYRQSILATIYLDALADADARRVGSTQEAATVAILGGLTTPAFNNYLSAVRLLERLKRHDERMAAIDALVLTGWLTYARLDWLATRAQAYGFGPPQRDSVSNRLGRALESLKQGRAANGPSDAVLRSLSPRDKLASFRNDVAVWLNAQSALQLENDLVVVGGATAIAPAGDGRVRMRLSAQDQPTLVATGVLAEIPSELSTEGNEAVLLITIRRQRDGRWPVAVTVSDDAGFQLEFTDCTFLRL